MTTKCNLHADCLGKIAKGILMPEKAFCYHGRCMQRRTALRKWARERNAIEKKMRDALNNSKMQAEVKKEIEKERIAYQEQLKALVQSELLAKAAKASKVALSDVSLKKTPVKPIQVIAIGGSSSRASKASKASKASSSSSGFKKPIKVISIGGTSSKSSKSASQSVSKSRAIVAVLKKRPMVLIPTSVVRAMDIITTCADELDDADFMHETRGEFCGSYSKRALYILNRWVSFGGAEERAGRGQLLPLRVDVNEYTDYEDDIFWFVACFKNDFARTGKDWPTLECDQVKESIARLEGWRKRIQDRALA